MNSLNREIPPKLHNLKPMSMPPTRSVLLDNGIDMMILDNGEEEVVRISVVIDGGMAESPEMHFVPQLAVQLAAEGTENFSGTQVAEILDFNGAWFKATTHSHHVSFTLFSLNSNLQNVLPVFLDMVASPTYPEKATVVEAEKMAHRLEVEQEKVVYYSNLEADRMTYGSRHPLLHDVSPDLIRQSSPRDLSGFHRHLLSPGHVHVYVAGRISPELEAGIVKAFSTLKLDSDGFNLNVVAPQPITGMRVDIPRPGALQSAVTVTIPAIERDHPDYVALRFAVMALGGYFGSRLMSNIRERHGYTYGISAGLLGAHEGGYIRINTQTDNRYLEQLLAEVEAEVKGMSIRQMDYDELLRLKRFYATSLTSQLDSPFSIMDYYINLRLAATPADYFEHQQEILNTLDADKIADVSAKYLLSEKMSVAVAGK